MIEIDFRLFTFCRSNSLDSLFFPFLFVCVSVYLHSSCFYRASLSQKFFAVIFFCDLFSINSNWYGEQKLQHQQQQQQWSEKSVYSKEKKKKMCNCSHRLWVYRSAIHNWLKSNSDFQTNKNLLPMWFICLFTFLIFYFWSSFHLS